MLIKLDKANKKKNIRGHEFSQLDQGDDDSFHELLNADLEDEIVRKKIEELEDKIEIAEEKGYQSGFQNGEKAGLDRALETLRTHIENLANLVGSLNRQQNEVIAGAEKFVVDFALKVADKIIGSEAFIKMQIDKNKLKKIVEQGLHSFPDSTKYEMRVHKQTAKTLEQYKPEILEQMAGQVAISIVEDPSLRPGDCLFESDFGVLDARIESQFEEIKNFFKMDSDLQKQ